MGAGRASIIAYTMPLWAALFSVFLIGERLRVSTISGLAFGAAGLAALIGPDIAEVETAPLGAIFMLAAAASWGLGTVLLKGTEWVDAGCRDDRMASGDRSGRDHGRRLRAGAISGCHTLPAFDVDPIAYVFLLPMIFGQWAFYKMVNLFSPTIAAVATMMVPVIGVISSSLMIPEPVGQRDLIALALISAALFSVLVLPTLSRRGRGQ
jgi:drug/metabolite transporter (DMT)-like permease